MRRDRRRDARNSVDSEETREDRERHGDACARTRVDTNVNVEKCVRVSA